MILQLLLSFYLFGASYGRTEEEIKTWFFTQAIDCNKEHPVSPEELDMMQKNQLAESQNAKCLMACVFRKTSWLDDKGSFNVNNAYTLADKDFSEDPTKLESAKKLFDLCKKVNEETVNDGEAGCDRSLHLAKCLIEHAPKMGFTI